MDGRDAVPSSGRGNILNRFFFFCHRKLEVQCIMKTLTADQCKGLMQRQTEIDKNKNRQQGGTRSCFQLPKCFILPLLWDGKEGKDAAGLKKGPTFVLHIYRWQSLKQEKDLTGGPADIFPFIVILPTWLPIARYPAEEASEETLSDSNRNLNEE